MKRVALAALAAAVLAGSALAATTNPKTIVLRRSDLRPGFHVYSPFHYVQATAASHSAGYITGYGGGFRNDAARSNAGKGAFEVDSYASVYRTAKGAKTELALSRRFCAQAPRKPLRVSPPLGDESVLCALNLRSAGAKIVDYVIAWRVGRVRGDLVVAGLSGAVHVKGVLQLARVEARRMS